MTTQAGFDLSEISPEKWTALCEQFSIDIKPVKTEKGWVWFARYDTEFCFVVTANNPISGEYFYSQPFSRGINVGFVGYVGIEGSEEFVFDFFHAFFHACDGYKEAVFGRRPFI